MFRRILLRGLFAVLPTVITIALLLWLLRTIELAFAFVLLPWVGEHRYVPGMGLALGMILVLVAGVLMSTWLVRGWVRWSEAKLLKLPLIKTLYGSVQDMLGLFAGSQKKDFSTVVTVEWGGRRVLGFITREQFDGMPTELAGEGEVAVYVPMSYQLGGFTLLVQRDQVRPVAMTLEDAMKFAITAGVAAHHEEGETILDALDGVGAKPAPTG